jgi:peptidoglycan-associated lipoprotein
MNQPAGRRPRMPDTPGLNSIPASRADKDPPMNASSSRIARTLLLAALASAVAVGCSKKVKEAPPADTAGTATTTTTPIDDGASTRPGAYGPADLDTDACLRNKVVYFDLDQDALKPEFQAAMACHAKYLRDRPSARLRLEGNADERGSREYNLALGQKRAESVRKVMNVLGVSDSQIETVSFGEEKPKAEGHDEASWAKNRRADIVYQGE